MMPYVLDLPLWSISTFRTMISRVDVGIWMQAGMVTLRDMMDNDGLHTLDSLRRVHPVPVGYFLAFNTL